MLTSMDEESGITGGHYSLRRRKMDKHQELEHSNPNRSRPTVLTKAELEMVSGGRMGNPAINTARDGNPAARNIGLDPGAVTRFVPRS
jgi:hypothetical protein